MIFLYMLLQLLFSVGLRIPYARGRDAVLTFLRDVCEPFLRLFRRFPRSGGSTSARSSRSSCSS